MGETQENWATCQNGWNLHLKYHLQLKTEEDVGGSDLGLQRGRRQFTWRWKSKCFINKCLLGHEEIMGHREEFWQTDFPRFLPVYTPSSYYLIYGDSSLPGTGPLSTFFRQLERRSKFLPESFCPWLFSAQNKQHAKETLGGGRILFTYSRICGYISPHKVSNKMLAQYVWNAEWIYS